MPGTIQILLLNREVKNTFGRVYTTRIGQLAQTICPSITVVKKKNSPNYYPFRCIGLSGVLSARREVRMIHSIAPFLSVTLV